MNKLEMVWAMDRDARFGQLAYILFWQIPETRRAIDQGGFTTMIDPFSVEDDLFEALLDQVIAERTLIVSDR
ncbi:MAG: hypothetical protein PHR28_14685 [candidate division Zixibacteria bacterium]|nr:hypothetical protein [candidate division Zixibacteria bacterium]